MLNMILDDWMPWHRNNYDFSSIDINRSIQIHVVQLLFSKLQIMFFLDKLLPCSCVCLIMVSSWLVKSIFLKSD